MILFQWRQWNFYDTDIGGNIGRKLEVVDWKEGSEAVTRNQVWIKYIFRGSSEMDIRKAKEKRIRGIPDVGLRRKDTNGGLGELRQETGKITQEIGS